MLTRPLFAWREPAISGEALLLRSRAALAEQLSEAESAGLRELFGSGPKGAQDLLNRLEVSSVKLPNNVTVNTLRTYGHLAKVMIDLGRDTAGTQVLRLRAVELLLRSQP